MKSYRTTALGVITILVALLTATKVYLSTGALPDIGQLITTIAAGAGLIAARDNKVTSEDAGAAPKDLS
jgi:hypothetical protein